MLQKVPKQREKSITAAVLGIPNVGKSSLINYLLGFDLTAVSSRPQTTRNAYRCIFTVDHHEIILVDTPGLHRSGREFNKRLIQQAVEGGGKADLNLMAIDLTRPVLGQLAQIGEIYGKKWPKSWPIFMKSDKILPNEKLPLKEIVDKACEMFPALERKFFVVSSKTGDGIHKLIGELCDEAPEGRHLYGGETSNKNERFFSAEYIREQLAVFLEEEVPYECAVLVDQFKDLRKREDRMAAHLSATILVNRPSQRAIVIGKKGELIKKIGMESRKKIEAMLGGPVYLGLHVKVASGWFRNNFILEELGLPRASDSGRVWRKR